MFANLQRLMEGLGGDLNDALHVQVFVGDASYRLMNQVWYRLFPMTTNPTARPVIQAALHGGVTNEMYSLKVIAHNPDSK